MQYREGKDGRQYPDRKVIQLKRVQTADGKEWIKSVQQLTGIGEQANEISITLTDPEIWLEPIFVYSLVSSDPKNPKSKKIRKATSVKGQKLRYDLEFNDKNLEALYEMRRGKDSSSVSMVISFCRTVCHWRPGAPPGR